MESNKRNLLSPQLMNRTAHATALGKRHVSQGSKLKTIDEIAQKIGFSNEEISELKRLYDSEFKRGNRS